MKSFKLTYRLIISIAAFLLPLGIMLFLIISSSLNSIQKYKKELNGIEVLYPAISLMQSVPQYMHFYIDNAVGDSDHFRNYSLDLLNELDDKYSKYYENEVSAVPMWTLFENWEHLSNTKIRNTVQWAYGQLIRDLVSLIAHIGNVSGLITDSEMESAYVIAAAVYELPQVQERLNLVASIIRTVDDGAFTQRRREELRLNLELLVHSDSVRIQKRFDIINSFEIQKTKNQESFEIFLKDCYEKIKYFSEAVENAFDDSDSYTQSVSVLIEAFIDANNAAYRLQSSALDYLQAMITERINSFRLRFIISLIIALLATVFAFTVIIATVKYIRKSTHTIGSVFKQLDHNDLSVQLELTSNDELGVLMKALNDFLDKLNSAFNSFGENANMVSTSAMELSASAQEITTTANEQSANIAEIVKTMESKKDLSVQAADKTVEVAQLASRTQELSQKGANLRDVNEDMMLDIQNQNHKIIENIRNLADMLSRIDESIQLIDSVADRTKIIAFNAALEASSSGEAGARFSVVASEIRRFADSVVESISEIKERISEIQTASQQLISEANDGSRAIEDGYNRMLEQKTVFENIVDVSQNVADRSAQISVLSKQQEITSSQVFSALQEISLGVRQFVSSSTMTLATVEKLNSMSTELKETIAKYHTINRGLHDKQ
jgi:methyl-accepting chemotaxis protein